MTTCDVLIVGAGPAGLSARSWLAQLGYSTVTIERAAQVMPTLAQWHFAQSWVFGHLNETPAQVRERLVTSLALSTHPVKLQTELSEILAPHNASEKQKIAILNTGERVQFERILFATGLAPVAAPPVFSQADSAKCLNAITLSERREQIKNCNIVLFGGGDNAAENALFLSGRGNRVTLIVRNQLKAQTQLIQAIQSNRAVAVRVSPQPPVKLTANQVFLSPSEALDYDYLAVLYGFTPQLAALHASLPACVGMTEAVLRSRGIYLAGDVSERLHPCIQTALADGVVVAKQIEADVKAGAASPVASSHAALSQASRKLFLSGLRFQASLGILPHEIGKPQPIQVDAELHLGEQAVLPVDDDIDHVLDYRKVRQMIIEECTAAHTNLLETLIGKLGKRLMQLPLVQGVRVKITKLEIFDDCEVALRIELGRW